MFFLAVCVGGWCVRGGCGGGAVVGGGRKCSGCVRGVSYLRVVSCELGRDGGGRTPALEIDDLLGVTAGGGLLLPEASSEVAGSQITRIFLSWIEALSVVSSCFNINIFPRHVMGVRYHTTEETLANSLSPVMGAD